MDDKFWTIFSAIATAGGAIGTFIAVLAALYIASRDRKRDLQIKATICQVISASSDYEILSVDVTNIGTRPVTISGVRIRVGMIKRKYFAIINFRSNFIDLPQRLEDGQSLDLQLPYDDFSESLPDIIVKNPNGFYWFNRRFIKFIVLTNVHEQFEAKMMKELRKGIKHGYLLWKKHQMELRSKKKKKNDKKL